MQSLLRVKEGELPLLYKTLDIQHLVCTTYHLYNTSFVQNLYIQQLICTTLTFTTSHLYNTLDTQHLDIQHFKFNVQPLIWELLYHTFPFKHFYLKIGSNQKVRAGQVKKAATLRSYRMFADARLSQVLAAALQSYGGVCIGRVRLGLLRRLPILIA